MTFYVKGISLRFPRLVRVRTANKSPDQASSSKQVKHYLYYLTNNMTEDRKSNYLIMIHSCSQVAEMYKAQAQKQESYGQLKIGNKDEDESHVQSIIINEDEDEDD